MFMVAILLWAQVSRANISVYIDAACVKHIPMSSDTVRGCRDFAFDLQAGRLWVLTEKDHRAVLDAYDTAGKKRQHTILASNLGPVSILYRRKEATALICYDEIEKHWVEVRIPDGDQAQVSQTTIPEVLDFDTGLAPDPTVALRKAMASAELMPIPDLGFQEFDVLKFLVNIPSLSSDKLFWSADRRTICLCSGVLPLVTMAYQQKENTYQSDETRMGLFLQEVIKGKGPDRHAEAYAAQLAKGTASFGVRIRDPKADEFRVAKVRIRPGNQYTAVTLYGALARTMHSY